MEQQWLFVTGAAVTIGVTGKAVTICVTNCSDYLYDWNSSAYPVFDFGDAKDWKREGWGEASRRTRFCWNDVTRDPKSVISVSLREAQNGLETTADFTPN